MCREFNQFGTIATIISSSSKIATKQLRTFLVFLLQLALFKMYVKEIKEEVGKRYYRNYYNNSRWYSYRWFLWLLLLIPLFVIIIVFCMRRRKGQKAHVVDNNQYYQTQQAGGYYNGPPPQGYPNNQYDNQYPPANQGPNQNPVDSGYGGYNQQQGYNGNTADVNTSEFQRPEGPPPAHYKS